jgi:hypothetical protein
MPVTLAPAVAPKETGGSPEFPDYPCEHMPRSQTPVVSRPLALAQTGLLPSTGWTSSALGPLARTYPLTTTIHFSEFNDAACALALPLLRTPPLSDRPSVRLSTCWLGLGRVGFFTHWVTSTIFKGVTLFHHPGFTLGTTTPCGICKCSDWRLLPRRLRCWPRPHSLRYLLWEKTNWKRHPVERYCGQTRLRDWVISASSPDGVPRRKLATDVRR